MEQWITVLVVNNLQEAYLIKSNLESFGIEVFLKDELFFQVTYSNLSGGVKIQVKTNDFKNAEEILINSGNLKKENEKQSDFFIKIEKLTSKIPLIGKLYIGIRLFILLAIILAIIATPLFLFFS